MTQDELRKPLGVDAARPQPVRSRFPFGAAAAVLVFAGALGLSGWIALANDPFGGEPRKVLAMPVQEAAPAPTPAPPREAPPQTAPAAQSSEPAAGGQIQQESHGVTVITGVPPRQAAARRIAVADVPDDAAPDTGSITPDAAPARHARASRAPTPVSRDLVEVSAQGKLPKIGRSGTRPADAYASTAFDPVKDGQAGLPRVAILLGGMGVSSDATASAVMKLPPQVALAFTPYGNGLDRQVQQARERGFEVFLQAPMEPLGYPGNDPGPNTLLTSNTPAQNIAALHWQMSRFSGYVGVTNAMGAKFTANTDALQPVLADIATRGLIYIDDGISKESAAETLARRTDLAMSRADMVIDTTATASGIDAALGQLEAAARKNGSALGVGSSMPITVSRLTEWALRLRQRGVILVPVTQLARR